MSALSYVLVRSLTQLLGHFTVPTGPPLSYPFRSRKVRALVVSVSETQSLCYYVPPPGGRQRVPPTLPRPVPDVPASDTSTRPSLVPPGTFGTFNEVTRDLYSSGDAQK